ncbi:MAG: MGMT family protein [Cyclobacteriaceae bacterium]|jgi:methylated-DNA-protein-cysteine methyltransferase-like protein
MSSRQATPNFFDDVYEVVKLIPRGRATSYGAIARYLGTGLSARMVGWAMHAAPASIPAHRVLNSQGMLSGKHAFKTSTTMESRLKKEGVKVIKDKVIDWKTVYWDPTTELL